MINEDPFDLKEAKAYIFEYIRYHFSDLLYKSKVFLLLSDLFIIMAVNRLNNILKNYSINHLLGGNYYG
jgi:hypothetical protein